MADVSNTGAGTRVALLARPGKAADNLADAVRQAGAELLVAVDPSATDEAALRALGPQALLIALEPSIETALDKFDEILVDPSMIVIFDEADVAAHRSGWDAQRWVRHLSAKLRRDSNVLPPGAESDTEWQPSPGKVPAPSAAYANVDMSGFTEEAVAHADSVPADGMPLDGMSLNAGADDGRATLPGAGAAASASEMASSAAAALDRPPADAAAPVPKVSFGDLELDAIEIESASLESVSLDVMSLESVSLESFEEAAAADAPRSFDAFSFDDDSAGVTAQDAAPADNRLQLDDDAFFLETLSNDRAAQDDALPEIRFGDFDPAALDFESVQAPPPKRDPETVLSFEELVARSMAASEDVPASESLAQGGAVPPPLPSPDAAPSQVADTAKPAFSLGELSLAPVDDDAPAPVTSSDKPKPAAHDLSALEARISGLSLVDIDEGPKRGSGDNPFMLDDESPSAVMDLSTPAAPIVPSIAPPPLASSGPPPLPAFGGADAAGVVLIEAGLGGPDPARQLLSSIPADFPAAILVRLHLQGGRYDRLVAQMERASSLPVTLAASGASANPGTIHFMPDGIGVEPIGGGRLRFVPEDGGATAIFAALPPGDSAIVFLSGSDPALVDAAMAAIATGTLVAAQTPEDCYDGAACAVLRSRGATSGLPMELAGRLAARWPN
jgi:chemosensory pili system protein ChpB (putative protein-glutamate methylesterase)